MKRVRYQTKSQIIYQALRHSIINGRYKPGERIVISQTARDFGASEIPVREAIKHLESDGLIKSTPHVGAVVSSFEIDEISKIYEVRTALETLALRKAIENYRDEDVRLLEKQIGNMERAIIEKKYEKLGSLNREFHMTMYSRCGNEFLCDLIQELWDLCSRTPGVFALVPERAHEANTEHRGILEALKSHDEELAMRLLTEQKNSSLGALVAYLNQHGSKEDTP